MEQDLCCFLLISLFFFVFLFRSGKSSRQVYNETNFSDKGECAMKKDIGISTPLYPAPALVVAAYGTDGRPGGLMVAWGGVCNSEPPCISVAVAKTRHTLEGIQSRNAFTVNIPSEAQAAEADFFGLASGRDTDKFSVAGLTPVRGEIADAPLIEEFPVSMECEVVQSLDLGSHFLFVGKVVKTWAREECLDEKGYPDPEKVRPLIFAPRTGKYFSLGSMVGKAFGEGKKYLRRRD